MNNESFIEPYDPMVEIGPGIYCIDGDWEMTTFRRRMTIIRLKSGDLMIHSAIRLRDEDYSKIDSLGTVKFIVVPNAFHSSEAHFYKQRYPNSKLFVSQGAVKEFTGSSRPDGILPEAWDKQLREEVDCLEFNGTRMLHENIFFHRASRTLILTDLVFNMQSEVTGFERTFFKLNLIYRRFGPSRIFRYVILNQKKTATESLQALLKWDFDQVVMSHGEIQNSNGKEALIQGFKEIGFTL